MNTGWSAARAQEHLLGRVEKNQLWRCSQCRRWTLVDHPRDVVCRDCKPTRRAFTERMRARRRSKTEAARKRKEREIQDRRVPKAAQLNRAINAAFRRYGRRVLTSTPCETAASDSQYRKSALAFLEKHKPELESDLRAYLAATRPRSKTPTD
jgi:hypothetical protein